MPGQGNQTTRDLAGDATAADDLRPRRRRRARSLAAAGSVGSDGHEDFLAGAPGEAGSAGAAYLVIGSTRTTSYFSRSRR